MAKSKKQVLLGILLGILSSFLMPFSKSPEYVASTNLPTVAQSTSAHRTSSPNTINVTSDKKTIQTQKILPNLIGCYWVIPAVYEETILSPEERMLCQKETFILMDKMSNLIVTRTTVDETNPNNIIYKLRPLHSERKIITDAWEKKIQQIVGNERTIKLLENANFEKRLLGLTFLECEISIATKVIRKRIGSHNTIRITHPITMKAFSKDRVLYSVEAGTIDYIDSYIIPNILAP